MAEYYNLTIKEIDDFLLPQGFRRVSVPNTNELVYGKRVDHNNMEITMRVYTGIDPSGYSRDVGEDAIRVYLFSRSPDGKINKLFGSKRVHRVKGWAKNLQARINDTLDQVKQLKICDRCGLPMRLLEGKSKSTGKPYKFYGCTGYPSCSNTRPAA